MFLSIINADLFAVSNISNSFHNQPTLARYPRRAYHSGRVAVGVHQPEDVAEISIVIMDRADQLTPRLREIVLAVASIRGRHHYRGLHDWRRKAEKWSKVSLPTSGRYHHPNFPNEIQRPRPKGPVKLEMLFRFPELIQYQPNCIMHLCQKVAQRL